MIDCCDFVNELAARGWRQAVGVPCSTFAGPIAHFEELGGYTAAANEGTALAGAAGSAIGGQRHAVFLQNSGLGNLINPLVSLVQPYKIPVLGFVSLRGWPDPEHDEPQHAVMGPATRHVLRAIGVWSTMLKGTRASLSQALDAAERQLTARRPAFILVPRTTIGHHSSHIPQRSTAGLPKTAEVVSCVAAWAGEDHTLVSTTGYTSRYLFAAADRPTNFYMQGSMGHAAPLALGYAIADRSRSVLLLDGDGALLMHLGALSTIGAAQPAKLIHLVLDNGSYASTGNQPASSRSTDLARVAQACGYRTAVTIANLDALRLALDEARASLGPHFISVRCHSGTDLAPPRASASVSLPDLVSRFAGSQL